MAIKSTRSPDSTRMFQEAASASHAVRAQLAHDAQAVTATGAAVRRLAPRAVVTCARGSSDHAATYAKYLIETRAGVRQLSTDRVRSARRFPKHPRAVRGALPAHVEALNSATKS